MNAIRNRRQAKAERRRHAQLLAAAGKAITKHVLGYGYGVRPEPALVVSLAFAMFAIRLDADEARDYLNAALAERGYPLLDDEEDSQ